MHSIGQLFATLVLLVLLAEPAFAAKLKVCATVPDLADLVRVIGGDEVEVTTFVKGSEDPHYLQARPSFIRSLSEADLYLEIGLDLESGWAPVLLRQCRNVRVQPGANGHFSASSAIRAKHDAVDAVDRSAGHVHAQGNPHYLLDPVNGLLVAEALYERLVLLRPEAKERFTSNWQAYRQQLGSAIFGQRLVEKYDPLLLARASAAGNLGHFLERTGETELLGGWLASMRAAAGTAVIVDHALWLYFADRFDLRIAAHLEPKPGIPPNPRHLQQVIEVVKKEAVPVILMAAYFPSQPGQFVERQTDATLVSMCHQVGCQPGIDSYMAMVDYNVRTLLAALKQ